MTETPLLALPAILAAQAQKHVTHNEALSALDALVHLSVRSRTRAEPPFALAQGDRFAVPAGATGAFAGRDGDIAAFANGAFTFHRPRTGWRCFDEETGEFLLYQAGEWRPVAGGSIEEVDTLGVNAAASEYNRLTVRSHATLLDNEGGGHRLAINRQGPGEAASLLFQTGYRAHAEIGLVGEEDLVFKSSEDGATFRDALRIDRFTGQVALPNTRDLGVNHLLNGDFSVNQRLFAGGVLGAGVYGFDRWKAAAGGAGVSLSGGTVRLASGMLVQIVEGGGQLAGRLVTVSVEDLEGGALRVEIAGTGGEIAPGPGRRGVTLAVPSGAPANLAVSIGPAAGPVTFARVRLEEGRAASGWTARPAALERILCQRFFERISGAAGDRQVRRGMGNLTGSHGHWVPFQAPKRATPAMTLVGATYSNSDTARFLNASAFGAELLFNVSAAGGFVLFGYAADAEL